MSDPTKPKGVKSPPLPLRVLLLEDNPRDAKLTTSVLEAGGYTLQYEVTDSPEVFRERLEKADYDVILADFNLRNWTAIDALETLKQSGKDIPLIVVTGSLGDEAAVECIKQGAADFVLKDRPARMPSAVQRALDEKRLRTENKRAFEAISRLATIVESSDDAIIGKTLDGAITSWNKGAEKLYGYSAAELLGQSISTLVPADRSEEVGQILSRVKRGERLEHFESVRVRKDGGLVDVSLSIFPLTDSRGEVTGIAAIARDITERKRAEQALRKSERKYRQLHESMMDGFVRLDMDGRIMEANDAFCQMLGYSLEELSKLPYKDLTPEKWQAFETKIIEEEVQTRGYSEVYSKEYRRKGGAIIPVELRTYLLLDESGDPCGMWAIVRDITERKWAEEMLREYEEVVEGSDEMIAVVDRDYCYLLANRAFLDQRGMERENVVGSSVAEVLGEEFFARVVKDKLDECFQGNVVQCEAKDPYTKLGERDIFVSYFPIEGHRGVDRAAVIMQDITERKQAEARLKGSEEKFRKAFMTGADAFYIATLNAGLILEVNDCFQEVFGYTREEVIGKTSIQLDLYADPADRAKMVSEVKSKGYVRNMEIRARRKRGEIFPLLISVNLLRESGEQLILGVLRDITEGKRAEEALKESEERYRTLFENAPVGIYRTTPEGRSLAVNPALAKMLGYSTIRDLLGRDLNAESFEAEYPRSHFMALMEERGEVSGLESAWRRKDGGIVNIRENARAIRDDSGKIVYYEGTVENITENKRAEAEHVRLVTAIEQSVEAVVITDIHGTIEYVNPAFTRITGYSREEARGQNPRILKSGKHDPVVYQQLWATILKGEVWHGELINRRKDGSLYTEEVNIAPVRNPRGELTHFIATKQDVTERKSLEKRLRQAARLEAIGTLAGGVAHDFNNHLTIINGYSDLVLNRLNSDDPLRGHLEEIKKAGERAASLTRQLLAFSRQQVLAPRILDLNALVADVQKMLRRLIGEDIDLAMVRDPALGRVKADPGQIEQILMNLAVNARDAMPQGGKLGIETANIELDDAYARTHPVVTPGHYVMLAVSDTGIGMDAQTQAHIFEPFFTTKKMGKGTGLGLAMVYGTVKQSGGYIWVYSEVGRGTTFKIYLPRIEEIDEPVQASEARRRPVAGSETILLVEDDEVVRALAARILQECGYKVLESENPEDALQVGERQKEPIDLLLTDVVLPGMSGRKVAEHLAFLRPGMKVLYMSGYTDDTIVRHGVLEADTFFLQKPFTPIALARKVREVLDADRKESS
jgi:PAS domain S-box-containing protein